MCTHPERHTALVVSEGETSAFKWRSALAGGRLRRCLAKCHQSWGHSPWNTILHFSRVFPSGSHTDRSSWLDAADNSKLLALRNESAGLRLVFKASDWEKCQRYSASLSTADLVSAGRRRGTTWLKALIHSFWVKVTHSVSEQEKEKNIQKASETILQH